MVNFYNFKQKVSASKKGNFSSANKTEIIEQVQKFLNETTEKMMIVRQENSLSIVPAALGDECLIEEVEEVTDEFRAADESLVHKVHERPEQSIESILSTKLLYNEDNMDSTTKTSLSLKRRLNDEGCYGKISAGKRPKLIKDDINQDLM